jgi:hypothetical protein
MSEPCIDCLCLAICKRTHILALVRKCPLFKDYIKMIECNTPRNSYRYLQLHALEMTYEVSKNDTDSAWWTLRRLTYKGKDFTSECDMDDKSIYINKRIQTIY